MSSYEVLQKLARKGYVFHGSAERFDVIMPNRREKLDPRAGLLRAVYATYHPMIAMFIAVKRPSKIPKIKNYDRGVVAWRIDKRNKARFRVTPNYIKYKAFDTGYVYILEKKLFIKSRKIYDEYYSRRPVKPVSIVAIRPEEFLSRVRLNIWPVEDLRKMKYTEKEIEVLGYFDSQQ